MEQNLDSLKRKLENMNVDFWEIFYEKIKRYSIKYKEKELEKSSEHEKQGIGIRILKNGVFYFYSTNKLNNIDLDKIKFIKIPGYEKIKQTTNNQKFYLKPKFNLEDLNFREILNYLGEKIKKFNITYEYWYDKRIILNSFGTEVEIEMPRNWIYYLMYVKENEKIENFYGKFFDFENNVLEKIDYSKIQKEIKILFSLLKAKKTKPGKYNVIINEELGGVLAHEAYGHACEIDLIKEGESVLKKGLKVGHEHLNIYDSPSKKLCGFCPIDDEGNKSKDRVLIKEGVVNDFLQDLRYGDGGNSRREDYSYFPYPRMSNTYIGKGDYSDEELFEEVKNGFMLCGMTGGQVNPLNGVFQFGGKYMYKIENGELKEIYKPMSFGGNILDIGFKIKAIGKEIKMLGDGWCGKNGQKVPVSDGSPKLFIKDLYLG